MVQLNKVTIDKYTGYTDISLNNLELYKFSFKVLKCCVKDYKATQHLKQITQTVWYFLASLLMPFKNTLLQQSEVTKEDILEL